MCIRDRPNHICGKGMINKIRTIYPRANITPIDYDPVSYTHLDVYKRQALHTRSRVNGSFGGYYTMTPQSGHNKTAPAAVLHGSMFPKPCASAQGRVQRCLLYTSSGASTSCLKQSM